jgi:hypothetical protein
MCVCRRKNQTHKHFAFLSRAPDMTNFSPFITDSCHMHGTALSLRFIKKGEKKNFIQLRCMAQRLKWKRRILAKAAIIITLPLSLLLPRRQCLLPPRASSHVVRSEIICFVCVKSFREMPVCVYLNLRQTLSLLAVHVLLLPSSMSLAEEKSKSYHYTLQSTTTMA